MGSLLRKRKPLSVGTVTFILVLFIAVAGAGLKFALREPLGLAKGWQAKHDLPALTVIDDSVVRWTGSDSAPSVLEGRVVTQRIRKDSLVRESMLAAQDVGAYGQSLLALDVDTLLSLTSGDSVHLVFWTVAGDTADTLSSAQVVMVSSGRALLAVRASVAPRAVMYQEAKRLGVVARPRPGYVIVRRYSALSP